MGILMEKKFVESRTISDWEIKTDDGWEDIMMTHKTIPYRSFLLETENFSLKCADMHIVFTENFEEVYVEDVSVGDLIITENGAEKVTKCEFLGRVDEMYDIEINSFEQAYYSNGILSHNTATAALYLLWYAMFNNDKTVLVTSYKMDAVVEVLDRIRYAYETCPDHIRCGVTTYSFKRIVFDNKSVIVGQTMTENTGRGMTISLLYCLDRDTQVTVKDKESGEEKKISIEKLYTELNDDILMGIGAKPKLRIQFEDATFIDVDEDESLVVNGIKTTIENICHGDTVWIGDQELVVSDIFMLDGDGKAV